MTIFHCFRNLSKNSSDMVFRLDQDEGAGGLSTHLGNLSMLMENSPKRSACLYTDSAVLFLRIITAFLA